MTGDAFAGDEQTTIGGIVTNAFGVVFLLENVWIACVCGVSVVQPVTRKSVPLLLRTKTVSFTRVIPS